MAAVFAISSITALHSCVETKSALYQGPWGKENSYLSRNRTTLAITITSHPLRHFERFFWVHKRSSVKRLLVISAAVRSWSDRSAVVLLTADISLQAK
jgi:hypothetical protein